MRPIVPFNIVRGVLACLVAQMVGATLPVRAAEGPFDSFHLGIEVGPVWLGQNDGRYGAQGTAYSARTVGQDQTLFLSQRLTGEARWGDVHRLILLVAPLDVTTRTRLDRDLRFRDTLFPAGTVVDSRYLFDGFRLSYLREVQRWDGGAWEVGASAQIRNAEVSFAEVAGSRYEAERDIGFVPILKTRWRQQLPTGGTFVFDLDALGAAGVPQFQGGILDGAASVHLPITRDLETFLRLRYLTGGATVPARDIQNWGQYLTLATGLVMNWGKSGTSEGGW
ncbi:MAG: hypothetical protein VKP72_07695 [bacterium]|nr:hypothetical protein [bacterium]